MALAHALGYDDLNADTIAEPRGEPTGQTIKIDDGKIEAYIATPPEGKAREGTGILYLPDVLGIWQNSKLMADNFAARGYTTLIPDLFNGDPCPLNRPADFDIMNWISVGSDGKNPHTTPVVDEITVKAIKALQDLGIKKIAAVGYCFGAKVRIIGPQCAVGAPGHSAGTAS